MNNTSPIPLRFFCLLAITTLLLSGCGESSSSTGANTTSLVDHQGKWLVINYWAVWCKPCIEEIPELNHLAAEHPQKLVLLGVDFDGSQGEQLQESIEKLSIEFPVLSEDPATTLGYKKPNVLPTTVIFNPQGQLMHTLIGPQTADSLLAKMEVRD